MKNKGAAPVIMLVVAAVAILIGLVIIASLEGTVDQGGWTSTANTTMTALFSTTYSALRLAIISLLVLAASLILGYLFFMKK
jgi:hypothetical protein